MQRNCPFHDLQSDYENDRIKAAEIKKAYKKGMTDILCALADHEIISMDVAAYMSGLNYQCFKEVLLEWRYGWMKDE